MELTLTMLANAAMGDPLLHTLKTAILELAPTMTTAERRLLAADIGFQAMEAEEMGESAVEAALIDMHTALMLCV